MTEEFDQALALQKQGDFVAAAAIYKSILEANADNVSAWHNLGIACHSMEEGGAAKTCYRKALELDPGFSSSALNLSAILINEQCLDEAKELLKRALQADPENEILFANLSHIHEQTGNLEEAERTAIQAISIDPDSSLAQNNLGVAKLRLRKFVEAEHCFRKALAQTPDSAVIRNNLGTALQKQLRYKEALPLFRESASQDSRFSLAKLNASWSLLQTDNFDQAIELAKEVINDSLAHDSVGDSLPAAETSGGMNNELARKALSDFSDLMNACKLEFFLVFGTLLGCVRDNDLISGDTDIDVGIWQQADLSEVLKRCNQYGFTPGPSTRDDSNRADKISNITFYYRNKIAIDVYRHVLEGEKLHCGFAVGSNQLLYEVSPFTLMSKEFLGSEYLVPEDFEQYLVECYGVWKTPQPDFETAIHSPNLVNRDAPHIKALAYYRIAQAALEGKSQKMTQLIDTLEGRSVLG